MNAKAEKAITQLETLVNATDSNEMRTLSQVMIDYIKATARDAESKRGEMGFVAAKKDHESKT